jgi:hypothetical protein
MDEKARSLTRLFTAETQRAQRVFVLCPSGDDDGQKQPNPTGKTDGHCIPPIAELMLFLCRRLTANEKVYLSVLCVSVVSTCSG